MKIRTVVVVSYEELEAIRKCRAVLDESSDELDELCERLRDEGIFEVSDLNAIAVDLLDYLIEHAEIRK